MRQPDVLSRIFFFIMRVMGLGVPCAAAELTNNHSHGRVPKLCK